MKIIFENEFMYLHVISEAKFISCGFFLGARVCQWSRIQKPMHVMKRVLFQFCALFEFFYFERGRPNM